MRISDWSSDVCSSDLRLLEQSQPRWIETLARTDGALAEEAVVLLVWCLWHTNAVQEARRIADLLRPGRSRAVAEAVLSLSSAEPLDEFPGFASTDRKRVVEGKSVSVRVDLGGRRYI